MEIILPPYRTISILKRMINVPRQRNQVLESKRADRAISMDLLDDERMKHYIYALYACVKPCLTGRTLDNVI